ncbi:MAG: FMN-binding protein [Ruminococcaceae bacterium]|nr:FMN-binding protein [Oscillospiraceae bacterium]
MSKIFKKSNIMPVIVLTAICLIIAAVLGVANMFTEDTIKKNESDKVYSSLKVVIDGSFEPMDKPEGTPSSVVDMYKVSDDDGKLKGYAITMSVQGYASEISLTVGVDKDGNVTKAVVTSQAESHGKAGMANYTDNFTGVSKDKVESVDTFSGATVSSTAIKNAIVTAVKVVTGTAEEEKLPREDSEIIALAKALVGKNVEFTDVTPEEMKYAKRIYKAGDEGYVAYTLVISGYGTPETETLIFVGSDGTIKDYNKLIWKTSDAMYGYVPPSDDVVNAFYETLIGKKTSELSALNPEDLVSNATNTSTKLRDALVEAMGKIDVFLANDKLLSEAEIKATAKAMIGKDVEFTDVTPDDLEYVKRIYKAGNEGYAVYAIVMSRYGTPETETLMHVGNDGKIKSIKKLIWKTSDAMYGYVPPTSDVVDVFYDKVVGMDKEALALIKNADLVSNATNTSTSLRYALYEGLDAVEQIESGNTPKIIGIVLIIAVVLLTVAYKVVPMIIKRRKNG